MTPEYRLFHGAALCELIDLATRSLSFGELHENGRLFSYTIENRLGLQIKHSAKRLSPWQFTFTTRNTMELFELRKKYPDVFVIFVCSTIGFVTMSLPELLIVLGHNQVDQAFVRIEKSRGKWFGVSGTGGELSQKKSNGVVPILTCLGPEYYECDRENT